MTSSSERRAVLLALLMFLSPSVASANDAGERGPYAVGFAFFVASDGTRSGRPIPIGVFYPADAAAASVAQPARYPRNPFVNPTGAVFQSTDFHKQRLDNDGLDEVFQEPTPAADGPFPLLALSQGARAPYWYNLGLAARFASHGFVVALMAHFGEAAYAGPSASDPLFHVAQRGLDRILDMKLVIDRMILRSSTAGDVLFGLVDPERVAAGGHSFGGLTAIQLVAGDDLVCDTYPGGANPPPSTCVPFTDVDRRVKALILYDPSTQNVHWAEMQRVTVPALVLGEDPASILAGFLGTIPPTLGMRAHHAFQGQPTYRADVLRTRHVPSFTNACDAALVRGELGLLTPAQVQVELERLPCNDASLTPYATAERILWRYAVSFGKTQLAGAPGYQRFLTPGWAITREPDVQFYETEKRNGLTPTVEFPDETWFFQVQPGIDMDMPVTPER
jgi:dienelactone hydrolase